MLERPQIKSASLTIRFSPILLAVFLAIQVTPLWASTNNVKNIDIIVKKKPAGAIRKPRRTAMELSRFT